MDLADLAPDEQTGLDRKQDLEVLDVEQRLAVAGALRLRHRLAGAHEVTVSPLCRPIWSPARRRVRLRSVSSQQRSRCSEASGSRAARSGTSRQRSKA